jgi:transposase
MTKRLPDTEVKRRLQQLRNVTRLHAVSRAKLLEALTTIQELRAMLVQKDIRIAELEASQVDKEAQRKELAAKLFKAKRERTQPAADQPKPGAQAGHTATRRSAPKPEEVTDRQIFDLAVCPACKHQVGEVVDKVERYQEDIDLAPRNKLVRHYTITRHWCPSCQEYVRPINTPAQNLRRFGPNLMGYILYARYRLRLPLLKIQESLADLHDFVISEGEIQNQLAEAKDDFGDQYDLICELIKSAKVVYADESGWRMDGDNWYIWAFVAPEESTVRYELVDTRGGGIAKAALGDRQDRVIVSDGYAVYGNLAGANQQCWIHLLRVAKTKSPDLYGRLCKLYSRLLVELEKPPPVRDKQYFAEQLMYLQTRAYNPKTEPLAGAVQARMTKHHGQLLVCLDYTNVLPENNTAERAIRPQVIMRKIFGGSRSLSGAQTHAVNTSVIATKLAQNPGKTFFEVMLPVIKQGLATQGGE